MPDRSVACVRTIPLGDRLHHERPVGNRREGRPNVPTVLAAAFLPILIAFTPTDAQTTWHVDATVCPATGSGSVADPFCKIQDAINAAESGDAVLVGPGEYVENVVNPTTPVTLRSTAGAAATIITAAARATRYLTYATKSRPTPR